MQPSSAIVDAYRAALPAGDVGEVDATPVDRTGVPVVAADFVGSGLRAGAFGYGGDVGQARVGAYGELAEALLLHRELRGRVPVAGSYAELVRERGPGGVVDPRSLTLPAGSAYVPEQPGLWTSAVRWRTGEDVLVPVEAAASKLADLPARPPAGPLHTIITNGSGAGDTAERAVSHGLLELLQRDGNATAFRALDRGHVLELDRVDDPVTRAVLDRLAAAGVEVLPKLASTQFGLPDLFVVGVDTDPGASPLVQSACGEACHPDREVALRKAVLEYAASRARRLFAHGSLAEVTPFAPPAYWEREFSRPPEPQEPRALDAMRDWSRLSPEAMRTLLEPTVLSRRTRSPFSALPTTPGEHGPGPLLADLLDRLADFDVLVVLAPTPTAVVAKVIVPGLEVETMSYGRVGERGVRKLLDAGSPLVGLGPPPHAGAAPVVLTDAARERLGGPAWLDRTAVAAAVGELYPLYREPDRHALARLEAGR